MSTQEIDARDTWTLTTKLTRVAVALYSVAAVLSCVFGGIVIGILAK